jgi:putative cytotoxic protein
MAKKIPEPSIFDDFEPIGAVKGVKRWRSDDGRRLYTWDALHGEVEVFNRRGKHLGVMDPETGEWIKDAVPGRSIDV